MQRGKDNARLRRSRGNDKTEQLEGKQRTNPTNQARLGRSVQASRSGTCSSSAGRALIEVGRLKEKEKGEAFMEGREERRGGEGGDSCEGVAMWDEEEVEEREEDELVEEVELDRRGAK